jgi:hypothetical protein
MFLINWIRNARVNWSFNSYAKVLTQYLKMKKSLDFLRNLFSEN